MQQFDFAIERWIYDRRVLEAVPQSLIVELDGQFFVCEATRKAIPIVNQIARIRVRPGFHNQSG
jgi:hypothetical protein